MLRRLSAVPLAVVLALLVAWPAAAAETYTVTTTDDAAGSCPPTLGGGPCTLRAAITNANLAANAGSTIHVPEGTYTLTSALPTITRTTLITGDGQTKTTISGNRAVRVFAVSAELKILALSDLTVANGSAADYGGNILVNPGAILQATSVRITGGVAPTGGGGIALRGASAQLTYSVVDHNTTSAVRGIGGGILASATSGPVTLLLSDTTVAANAASDGGGVATTGNAGNTTTLQRVTVADNVSASSAGGGLYASEAMKGFTVSSSIIARNTGNLAFSAPLPGPSDCGAVKPVDGGQNVESVASCGFTSGSQNADPGLARGLVTVNDTYVLPLLAGSPAIDRAVDCGTGTTDQVGTVRPQGPACDSGAFESIPVAPQPTPTATPAPQPTTSPAPTPTATVTPAPTPTPVFHQTVVVEAAGATILVRPPGSATFTPLPAVRAIKLGSTVDARKGVVVLTSTPKAGGKPETAKFYDGMFKVTQSGAVTTLTLNEPLAPCASHPSARAAAKKPKTRKLWGDGKGRFRTKGQYSAATIRGTKWLVQDGCRYTRTRVAVGAVTVRDAVRRKTIVLRKGKSYTARARK